MTEEKKKCNCCLLIGIIVLGLGIVSGMTGEGSFGLMQILAIIAGLAMILCGLKGSKFCKCCNK